MSGPDWRDLKVHLQSVGVVVDAPPAGGATADVRIRRGGAGPAQGVTLRIGGSVVSVPAVRVGEGGAGAFRLTVEGGRARLAAPEAEEVEVEVLSADPFGSRSTRDGVPFGQIALIHGGECLASTVIQSCAFWGSERACRFCGIGTSLEEGRTIARKTPAQLVEVAEAAVELGLATHVVLTSGCTDDGEAELGHLAACARALKESVGLPVSVQCRPPADPSAYGRLRAAGVDSVGVHIESLDPRVLARVAPVKAAIGWCGYRESWREAVTVFGRGQVVTYIIMGLGERLDVTERRLLEVAALGVYPHVVPFRPVPGARLEEHPRPPASLMRTAYRVAAEAVERGGLSARDIHAGCGRCTACSALADWEPPRSAGLIVRVARPEELDEVFDIRREAFCHEQGLFLGSDRDEHDTGAVHLVALAGREVVGTVRLYELEPGAWVGGRLAVRPSHRGRAGFALVQAAVSAADRRGALTFTAAVQARNERFFHRLGWTSSGDAPPVAGVPHVLMTAPLPSRSDTALRAS